MTVLTRILVVLSCLLLAAHFMRADEYGPLIVSAVVPVLLLFRQRWTVYVLSGLLLLGSIEWVRTAAELYHARQLIGQPAGRMLLILGIVAAITFASTLLLLRRRFLEGYVWLSSDTALASAFFLSAIIISLAHLKVRIPILLFERFQSSFGWLEIFVLSIYATWIAGRMLDRSRSSYWRRRIWAWFSLAFFAQVALGLSGLQEFLMTGDLHVPVPAMIVAGPIYRESLSIMVFLFIGSVMLLGPAWCSHLCYIGVWDDVASRARRTPKKISRLHQLIRVGILVIVILSAIALKRLGMHPFGAGVVGLGFGLFGVAVMLFWSRRLGVMSHCITYCPIGLIAVILGRINPFRIRIDDRCTNCAICRPACRYNALNVEDIKRRRPNINCTLCGDCLGKCEDSFIQYRFFGLQPERARTIFIVLAVSLHTAFLAAARI